MEEKKEKEFFKDGWSSFGRLVIGIFISQATFLVFPFFVGYQILMPTEPVDIQEMFLGYALGSIIFGLVKINFMLSSALGTS